MLAFTYLIFPKQHDKPTNKRLNLCVCETCVVCELLDLLFRNVLVEFAALSVFRLCLK